MVDKSKIVEALKQLDPTLDEHWTEEGLPALDAVVNYLGEDVQREAVTKAAPKFTRDSGDLTSPQSVTAENDQHEEKGEEDGPKEDRVAVALARIVPPADEVSKENVRELVDELQGRVDEARKDFHDGQRFLKGMEDALNDMIALRDRLDPPPSQAEAYKAHLASEHRKRYIAAGIDPDDEQLAGNKGRERVTIAQIDRVMARSTGHGNRRPRPYLLGGKAQA